MPENFNRKKIKMQRTKIAIAVALILMLSAGMSSIIPEVNAHTPPWTIPTYAYVVASPPVVGVGQYTQIVMWLNEYPRTAGGLGGDRWRGFKLDITKPDGTKTTLSSDQINPTSQVGSTWALYTPDQAGTYTIVFSWPGQTLTNGTGVPNTAGLAYVGDYYQPSTSEPLKLVVTQAPLASWQEPPLPTGYWTLPITGMNRYWSPLASNYLGGSWFRYSSWQEWGQAPNSAHVLWAQPLDPKYFGSGGILDAQWPGIPEDVNDYETFISSPMIMDGKIYFNTPQVAESNKYGYYALNLYTGQTIWYKNGTDNGLNNPVINQIYSGLGGAGVYSGQTFPSLSFAQLYHYNAVNGQGVLPYLWMTFGNTWYMLDANTGNWIMSLINVPGGTGVTDQDGSILRYSYTSRTGQFLCWNLSQAIYPASPIGTGQQQWKPMVGATIDAVNDTTWQKWGIYQDMTPIDIGPHSGYTMNVTNPSLAGLPGLSDVGQDSNRMPTEFFMSSTGGTSDTTPMQVAVVKINYGAAPYSPYPNETYTQNTNLGYTLTLLLNKTIPKPVTGGNFSWSIGPIDYEDGVFCVSNAITRQWWGYSLTTGQLLWGPTYSQSAWDFYGTSGSYAYGLLLSGGYGGVLHAYNIKNGQEMWNYTLTNIGYESPYGNYPLSRTLIADGKIYLTSTEHSPTKPLWRGSYLRSINITNGQEIWKLSDFSSGFAEADGYIVTVNQYDNKIYCIGKGPSAVTVSTSAIIGSPTGVLIQGFVTDQSPGAKGTPAIADASQQGWMEYLYEQQAMPTNATGVPVHLTATDPNGNYQDIGTPVSDTSGLYSIMWTPPVSGKYTVTATFAGSNSYGSSSAEVAFGYSPTAGASPIVSPTPKQTQLPTAPQVTTTPTPTQAVQPPAGPTPTATYIAIGAAIIVIVVAAAAIALRRRK